MDKKYTTSGLPVLTREIVETRIAEWVRKKHINFIEELDRIKSEDPMMGKIITQYINQSTDPESVGTGMITMYKLLEAQSEANRLDDEFKH